MGRVRAYKAVQGQLKGSTTAVATIVCPVNTPPQVEFRNLQGRIQEETIQENADVGKLVAIVSVTDTDMGDNGRTTVRITRGNEDGLFTLDSSGDFHVLRTASKISSNHQYRITVEAKDSGTPARTSTASLVIRVPNSRDYRIELRGGDGVSYGNVYAVNRLGTFGPVCDDEWGSDEANTVCRQLGFDYGRHYKESHFGVVPSAFAMDNVQCGSRTNILQECSYSTSDGCGGSEGAGVRCYNGNDTTTTNNRTIELRGGDGVSYGNVYAVNRAGTFGPVC